MSPIIHQIAATGVEEEFHTVDLATRRLTAQADRLMEQLPAGSFSLELQRSVLEANSRPWNGLTDLAGDIAALRQAAIAAAEPLGLGIVPPAPCPSGRRNPRHPDMAAGHRACPCHRQRDPNRPPGRRSPGRNGQAQITDDLLALLCDCQTPLG